MVYVDMLINYGGWFNKRFGPSCHMMADTEDELHLMANSIGMRRSWFQSGEMSSMPHYDLTAGKRAKAVSLGAVEIDRKTLCKMLADYREKIKTQAREPG